MKLQATMVTDVGVVRDHNEDCAHVDSAATFFIVADGMGGHAAGEVASAMAVETVRNTLEAARPKVDVFAARPTEQGRRDLVQLLQNAVLAAHQAVYQRGTRESDKQGMGTTLDVVLVAGPEAFIAHVGDSRTYLVRDGRAAQITTDHTVAEVLVIEGKLSIEEAQVSPLRTILVNAIGVSADVGVEMAHLQLRRSDRLLLCSDGLHDYFPSEQEIADKISSEQPHEALAEMVEMAKDRGGHDNITGICVEVLEIVQASDGVPSAIDHDQTLPVDLAAEPAPPAPPGWNEEETTQNIPDGALDEEDPAAPGDDEDTGEKSAAAKRGSARVLRKTQPMPTVAPGRPPKVPAATEAGAAAATTTATSTTEGDAPATPDAGDSSDSTASDDDDDPRSSDAELRTTVPMKSVSLAEAGDYDDMDDTVAD